MVVIQPMTGRWALSVELCHALPAQTINSSLSAGEIRAYDRGTKLPHKALRFCKLGARQGVVQAAAMLARDRVAPRRRKVVPDVGHDRIGCAPESLFEHSPQGELGTSASIMCAAFQPLAGQRVVLRDCLAIQVKQPKRAFRGAVSPLRRPRIPADGFPPIRHGQSQPSLKHTPQKILCALVAVRCERLQHVPRQRIVSCVHVGLTLRDPGSACGTSRKRSAEAKDQPQLM